MNSSLTRVALIFDRQRINTYLRFGQPRREHVVDARRRVAEFDAGAVFCRVRWEANVYGTTVWQLAVLQAIGSGMRFQRVAGVVPGATLLLHVGGARKTQSVLALVDTIEAAGCDPVDVATDYWRLIHHRLVARAELPAYSPERHAAHLARRRLG